LQEFVHALKANSKRATREDKLRMIFVIFDVDNDGVLSPEDLELMVRQLAGSSLSCVALLAASIHFVDRSFPWAYSGLLLCCYSC
jgi:hypothetical protein